MIQKQPRRTEQEWMILIQQCRSSGLSDKDWCEQHSIPASTFYTKITKLRKKACDIPKTREHIIHKPQQVVPLQIMEEAPLSACSQTDANFSNQVPTVIINLHEYRIEITNHAARETITNILSALQQLC